MDLLNCTLKTETFGEENNLKTELSIPEGYEFLPSEFFPYQGILAPLVSKSWLALIKKKLEDDEINNYSTEEDSEDDTISLAELKNKLLCKNNQHLKISDALTFNNDIQNCKVKNSFEQKLKQKNNLKNKEKKKQYPVINRKRGRPRKNDQNINGQTKFSSETNKILTSNDKDFWEEQTSSSNLPFPLKKKINSGEKNTEEENIVKGINYKDHDHFKLDTNYSEDEMTENEDIEISKNHKASNSLNINDSKSNFPCLECGKSFSASSTLKNHQRIHNGTLIKCLECHKGFMTKYLLKCHMRIHNGDLFMCHICKKGFTTAELLKVHNRCHTGDKPFVCNICGRSFPCASNLSQHKQTHDSEKKFLCSHCGSSFNQKRCLDGHMLRHTEKNHICTVCGKLWARKPDLIEHMRVHTGQKPYCCSTCPQKFTQASSLKRHQIVHMDVKPIQCLICNKMFKCQDYYKRHLKKHDKESYLFNNVPKYK